MTLRVLHAAAVCGALHGVDLTPFLPLVSFMHKLIFMLLKSITIGTKPEEGFVLVYELILSDRTHASISVT